ncbi:MAG: hypothetical protein ACREID_03340, partial [Planctomycetota bacterium]
MPIDPRPLALVALLLAPSVGAQEEEGDKSTYDRGERKTTETLVDPITGESFEHPLPTETEIVWTDRLLRGVGFGEHPRLRQIQVSPFTGFATYRDPALWKQLREEGDAAAKAKVRAALARFPRRYRAPAAVPALHRYALAEITYEALGRLNEEMRARIALDALH